MEGQQPDSGDLSSPDPDELGSPDPDDLDEAVLADRETEEVVLDPAPVKPVKEPSPARKWLAGNGTRVAVVSSAGLFVAAGAFAGAAAQPYLADRATVDTKLRIATTAADAITTLWSYTPDDMDTLPQRSARYLSGDFAEQYRQYVDAIAPTNKQARVSSATQVVGAGVETLSGSEATAIVYTNTTSTTPQDNNIPSMKYLSYRLNLQREGRDWRVTRMTTVTSLDLTPKL